MCIVVGLQTLMALRLMLVLLRIHPVPRDLPLMPVNLLIHPVPRDRSGEERSSVLEEEKKRTGTGVVDTNPILITIPHHEKILDIMETNVGEAIIETTMFKFVPVHLHRHNSILHARIHISKNRRPFIATRIPTTMTGARIEIEGTKSILRTILLTTHLSFKRKVIIVVVGIHPNRIMEAIPPHHEIGNATGHHLAKIQGTVDRHPCRTILAMPTNTVVAVAVDSWKETKEY